MSEVSSNKKKRKENIQVNGKIIFFSRFIIVQKIVIILKKLLIVGSVLCHTGILNMP